MLTADRLHGEGVVESVFESSHYNSPSISYKNWDFWLYLGWVGGVLCSQGHTCWSCLYRPGDSESRCYAQRVKRQEAGQQGGCQLSVNLRSSPAAGMSEMGSSVEVDAAGRKARCWRGASALD